MADPRLTPPSYLVLGIVDKLGAASPYDVKMEAGLTGLPFWHMPHAQVYTQCDRLVEAGLLSETRQKGGRHRRVLRLTEAGRAAMGAWLADTEFVPVQARERAILKLWFGADGTRLAPEQVTAHRESLANYESIAESADDLLTRGQREALEFGIRYEQMMVEFWQWVSSRGE